jgi:hypothetical protein
MKLKDWVAVMVGIDEYDIENRYDYYNNNKDEMLKLYGEKEIDEIQVGEKDGDVFAIIFLKN